MAFFLHHDVVLELLEYHRAQFLRHDPCAQGDDKVGLAIDPVGVLFGIKVGLVDERTQNRKAILAAFLLGGVAHHAREIRQILPQQNPVAVVEELPLLVGLEPKLLHVIVRVLVRGFDRWRPVP